MIIVSQDKCTIVNLDNIKTIELDRETDFKSIIIFRETSEVETGVCGLLIGHYTTKERAKEVLQEIIEKWEQGLSKNKLAEIYRREYNQQIKIIRATTRHRHDGKYIGNYEALAKVENVIYRYLKETE